MKKCITFLLCLGLALSFAACGKGGDSSSSTSTGGDQSSIEQSGDDSQDEQSGRDSSDDIELPPIPVPRARN